MSRQRPSQQYGPWLSRQKDGELVRDALLRVAKGRGMTEEKLQRLGSFVDSDEFPKEMAATFGRVARATAPRILKSLKRDAPAMFAARRPTIEAFEERLYTTWKKPLDLLEMLWVASAEVGEGLSGAWPWKSSEDDDLVFDVLRRLHARGCQVLGEVHTLLRAGYAPGAHARWRTLHETAATASFIFEHGKDVAERYRLHEHVEAYKAAEVYQKYCARLHYRPYTKAEMDDLRANRDAVVQKYGLAFGGAYGWAAAALGRTDKGVDFSDVEEAVKLDHLRPYYKMASYPVHANPKAITFTLAMMPGSKTLLTGPSNLGLADPGHGAAISVLQLTTTLLAKHPTLDAMIVMRALGLLVDEIGKAFLAADKALKKRGRDARRTGHRKNPSAKPRPKRP